jgi:peptidoglycan/LPS O-acetylase OafA/YrhL
MYAPDLRSSLRVDVREVLIHLSIGQGLTGDYFASFSQTWSLTTEVTFYLIVPAIGAWMIWGCRNLAGHARRVQRLEIACLGVMAVGVGFAAFSASTLPGASSTLATSLLGHAAWFAVGIWVCVRSQRHGQELVTTWPADQRLALAAVLFLVAASPLGGNLLFEQPAPWQAATRELLYMAVAGLLVSAGAALRPGPSPAVRLMASAPLHWLGTRSYALFLWHLPVLFGVLTVLKINLFEGSFILVASLTFALSILIADLSWRLVEQPILTRAHRVGQGNRRERNQQQPEPLRQRG